jgi:hypothetical protein
MTFFYSCLTFLAIIIIIAHGTPVCIVRHFLTGREFSGSHKKKSMQMLLLKFFSLQQVPCYMKLPLQYYLTLKVSNA